MKSKDNQKSCLYLRDFMENPDNPSVATDEDIQRLAGKLKRVPLGLKAMRIAYVTDMVSGKNVVISGNKRLRVLKSIYGEDGEVPSEWFVDVTAMSEAERHEFIVSANVSDGSWDVEKLLAQYDKEELGELLPDSELQQLLESVAHDEQNNTIDQEKYTANVTSPRYDITGEEPSLEELVDKSKYDDLVSEIRSARDVPDDIKLFLEISATRHIVFDYAKVAEYYAHADKKVQKLMERSALVIIDFDDAIENGYVNMCSAIEKLRAIDVEKEAKV